MDQWGPKHVELTYVMNKTLSLSNIVYLVGLHIYYKMIHGPYNIKISNEVRLYCLHINWTLILPVDFMDVKLIFYTKGRRRANVKRNVFDLRGRK